MIFIDSNIPMYLVGRSHPTKPTPSVGSKSSSPSHSVAPCVAPAAGHGIIDHLLTEGRAYARLLDGERIILDAGDIVIFPHGDARVIENGPPTKPVDMVKELTRIFSQGLKQSRQGGGGRLRDSSVASWLVSHD